MPVLWRWGCRRRHSESIFPMLHPIFVDVTGRLQEKHGSTEVSKIVCYLVPYATEFAHSMLFNSGLPGFSKRQRLFPRLQRLICLPQAKQG